MQRLLDKFADIPLKIFIIILISNISTMITMNLFVISTNYFVYIYSLSLFLSYLLIRKIDLRFTRDHDLLSVKEKKWLICALIFMAFLFILPRSGYVIEYFKGYVIRPICFDDIFHLQEVNSLINSEKYPPVSSFDKGRYLSFHYASWMLIVFIYKIFPFRFNTIKISYFIGYSFYILFMIYLAPYFSYRVSRTKTQFYFLFYLIFFYAGFESFWIFFRPLSHNEWWMNEFGLHLQISSFSTIVLWAIHNLSAAASLVIAYFLYEKTIGNGPMKIKFYYYLCVSLLLVNAFYSSVFVVIGSLPFIVYILIRDFKSKKIELFSISILSSLFALPLLWVYLARIPGFLFFEHIKRITGNIIVDIGLNAGRFLSLIFLELFVYFVAIGAALKKISKNKNDLILLILSAGFMLSLFFVSYAVGNNYAMRGSIIPIFVLAYIASKYFIFSKSYKIIILMVLFIFSLGSFNEIMHLFKNSFVNIFDKDAIELRRTIYNYNTNRNIKQVDYLEILSKYPGRKSALYLCSFEKLAIKPWLIPKRASAFFELMSEGPFFIWSYQDWVK
jgi:hypothetical protein